MRTLLVIVMLFAGCATGTIEITSDSPRDPRRFERDRYECRRDATYMDPGTSVGIPLRGGLVISRNVGEGPELNRELFAQCMNVRGYTVIYR